jgi:hypothetical protein
MPTKQSVWSNDASKKDKSLPAHRLAFDRQPSALVIGKTRAFTQLFLENSYLLLQVFDDGLRSAIHPSGKANQQKRQRIHRKTIPLSVVNDQFCLRTGDFRSSRITHNIN